MEELLKAKDLVYMSLQLLCRTTVVQRLTIRYTDAEEAYFMAGVAFLILALVVAIIRLMSAVRINKLTLKLSAKT